MDVLWPQGVTTYLQGHLRVLTPGQEDGVTKQSCPSQGGMFAARVSVLSLPAFSIFPERNLSALHPTPHPASPLLHAIPKEVASSVLTGCAWFSSSPFSAFLLLHQLPAVSASCSQTLFAGQTLKLRPSLLSSMTPLMSTQKTPREFTRNIFNN